MVNPNKQIDILIQNLIQEVNGFMTAIGQMQLGFASRFNDNLQKLLAEINQQKQDESPEGME